jgi:site-specific DNA-cytosine methylase
MILTLSDIACGAGMASLGVCDELVKLGYTPRILCAVDPWAPAVHSYRANLAPYLAGPNAVLQARAEDILIPRCDLLLSGPPCIRDSTMAKARHLKDDGSVASVKTAARTLGAKARWEVMETVGRSWEGWGAAHGFSSVRLVDANLGGATSRRRTLLLRGLDLSLDSYPRCKPPGWGKVVPLWSEPGVTLGTDANAVHKRVRLSKLPHEPAPSVVGHGGALLRYRKGQQTDRLTPEEHAPFQGFETLCLVSARTRERQTLVGNGWPRTFGRWVAHLIHANIQASND